MARVISAEGESFIDGGGNGEVEFTREEKEALCEVESEARAVADEYPRPVSRGDQPGFPRSLEEVQVPRPLRSMGVDRKAPPEVMQVPPPPPKSGRGKMR